VLVQGTVGGAQVASVEVAGDSIVYTESTAIPMAGFQQRSTVVLNADLTMRRADQAGTARGEATTVHLDYTAGRVKGTSLKSLAIDTTLAPGTIDDNALQLVLTALPLAQGKTFTFNVFSSGEGVTKVITVKVTGVEQVKVPAGTSTIVII
jgi:hypothetical protein